MKQKQMKSKKSTVSGDSLMEPLQMTCDLLRHRVSQLSTPPQIHGYDQERRQLLDLIRRTGTTGESNSALLIGPRGCGKSMLVENVVEELMLDIEIRDNLLHVHLNGLLQTDDKIALKEITRQLQLENTVGTKVFGSFAETLQFLLDALKSGSHSSKPILFVLDEFDLFAHHKNQTLLYNLFDVAQSAQAPVCVLGLTCRLELASDQTVLGVLRRQFEFNKDVRSLQQLLMYPVCCVNENHPLLLPADFVDGMKIQTTDTKSAMLHGVSILELCLIIAMKHLTEIYDGEPFNFEMVYSEYRKFAQKRSSMQVYEKAVVLKAFEHLIALELVKTMDGSGSRVQKEYRLLLLLVHPSQILDALQKYPNCPTEVKQWAQCSVI